MKKWRHLRRRRKKRKRLSLMWKKRLLMQQHSTDRRHSSQPECHRGPLTRTHTTAWWWSLDTALDCRPHLASLQYFAGATALLAVVSLSWSQFTTASQSIHVLGLAAQKWVSATAMIETALLTSSTYSLMMPGCLNASRRLVGLQHFGRLQYWVSIRARVRIDICCCTVTFIWSYLVLCPRY